MRYAVIPTHDRPQDFADCYAAIAPQVDQVIIISHGAPYADPTGLDWPDAIVTGYGQDPPNISAMWNLGLTMAYRLGATEVAVLNDDVVVPSGWFDRVTRCMFVNGAVVGGSGGTSPIPLLCRKGARPGAGERVPGFAFILAGFTGLLLDEQFQWWYGDDDLMWRAADLGGTVLVPGLPVEHRHPNSTTVGELARIAGQDRERFAAKWGRVPH